MTTDDDPRRLTDNELEVPPHDSDAELVEVVAEAIRGSIGYWWIETQTAARAVVDAVRAAGWTIERP